MSDEPTPPGYSHLREVQSEGPRVRRYQATRISDGGAVEIHVLLPLAYVEPEVEERFLTVIRNLGRVRHPGILPLLDAGIVEERPYFVTPWRRARRLSRILEDRGGLIPVKGVLVIGLAVAEALGALHTEGIVHRSVSADTIFVPKAGPPFLGECAALRDLGTLRPLNDSGTLDTSRPSPESLLCIPETERTDIYHLCAVLYHALTGTDPLSGGARGGGGIAGIAGRNLSHLAEHTDSAIWPHGLADLVMAGLSFKPENRPANVGILIDALRQVAGLKPRKAPPPPGPGNKAAPPPKPVVKDLAELVARTNHVPGAGPIDDEPSTAGGGLGDLVAGLLEDD